MKADFASSQISILKILNDSLYPAEKLKGYLAISYEFYFSVTT